MGDREEMDDILKFKRPDVGLSLDFRRTIKVKVRINQM